MRMTSIALPNSHLRFGTVVLKMKNPVEDKAAIKALEQEHLFPAKTDILIDDQSGQISIYGPSSLAEDNINNALLKADFEPTWLRWVPSPIRARIKKAEEHL